MKLRLSTRKANRLVLAAIGASLVAFMAYFAYQRLRPPVPEEIRDQTVRALETGDAGALLRYADRMEVERLHLTPAAVAALLNQTLWRTGRPVFQHPLTRLQPQPVDVATWVYYEDSNARRGPLVYIPVIMDRDGRWYLNLSRLLEVSYLWNIPESGNVPSMRDAYREAALRYGIAGVRGHGGGWVMFTPGSRQDWQPKQTTE